MGELILIPNQSSGNTLMRDEMDLTLHLQGCLPPLDHLLAESHQGARRWLKSMALHLPVTLFEEVTSSVEHWLQAHLGEIVGLISDAGYPSLADPGAAYVLAARTLGYKVALMPGTSPIAAAVALSGLPAQRFAFQGYLPRKDTERGSRLQTLERASCRYQGLHPMVQVFIETPYRHEALMNSLLTHLKPTTLLCVAQEVGNQGEWVQTHSIHQWRQLPLPKEGVTLYLIVDLEDSKEPRKNARRGGGYGSKGDRGGVSPH